MPRMAEWAGPHSISRAKPRAGAFGDTGSMARHAPPAVAEAVAAHARRGITATLPTEDASWVSDELARRLRLPYWQFALTATDANRFVLRIAGDLTARPKALVFSCVTTEVSAR